MNAALQCLFSTVELVKYFATGAYKYERFQGNESRFVKLFAELVGLYRISSQSFEPDGFLDWVKEQSVDFANHKNVHNCPSEFLKKFFEALDHHFDVKY